MKIETNETREPTGNVFPMEVTIRGIESINYIFNPETLKPWSDEVVKHDDVLRKTKVKGTDSPSVQVIPNEDLFSELVAMQCQLSRDSTYARKMRDFSKPFEIQLQRCALLINLAKCWEDWGFKMHAMFKVVDKDATDRQLKFIYSCYIIDYYQNALESLGVLGESISPEITKEQKNAWATMLLYAYDKFFATYSIYKTQEEIDRYRKLYNDVDDLVFKNGCGHLIPDYTPTEIVEYNILKNAKNLLWSTWERVSCAFGVVEQPSHKQTGAQQNAIYSRETSQIIDMPQEKPPTVITEDEPLLKNRKSKNPNKDL